MESFDVVTTGILDAFLQTDMELMFQVSLDEVLA